MRELEQYLDQHQRRFVSDLCDWLRIPSVSTDKAHGAELRQAAAWLAGKLTGCGIQAELIETSGNPVVYAETPPVPGAPTVLVYGHYDVQPADPLDEWTTPPFEPVERDGNLYARGATDDKGQVLTHVHSVEAWLATVGRLPLQVKFLIEGEEEIGSEGVEEFIGQAKDKLACDVVVISDSSQYGPGQPAITYGLKGIAYFELRLNGARQDLHSGTFGGAVTNPLNALTRLMAHLVDDQGRIQVPGFYDDVAPLTDRERSQFAALGFSDELFQQQLGVTGLSGEAGYTTLERRWARPTCDLNGIWGGYQASGAKTVLPAKAGAKFSFRLVPNQDPAKIERALRSYLAAHCPPGITLELEAMHAARGIVVPLDSPYMQAAAQAIECGFERPPVFAREGGSIPIVSLFRDTLGADSLLLGWGLDDDNAQGPNEKFCLADYHRGTRASAHLWELLGKIATPCR
jgi:succinyl-diaminopimelate desuccinylase